MALLKQTQTQSQKQTQIQRMSHLQIQAVNLLAMSSSDLRELIYKEADENPAIEIVRDTRSSGVERSSSRSKISADDYQRALEATEDRPETLQAHLMHQLNSINLSQDEYNLSQKLIYNLDSNGFYGTMLAPESLIDKNRPLQTKEMLQRCIKRIQRMDPVGTCCKGPEESLFVQAQIDSDCPKLALFILDGHIELLNPPEPSKVFEKLEKYQKDWHSKKFAGEILLDKLDYSVSDAADAIKFILQLNIHPAQDYLKDTNKEFETPDIVLKIERKEGGLQLNDYSKGLVMGDKKYHFQIKYASGTLPELKLAPEFSIDKANYQRAKELLDSIAFRESSIILQGCAIVNAQKDFFLKGTQNLVALTRKQVADELGIHESTVSRMSAKKGSKYIQTEWGLYPASFFFSSGVQSSDGNEKISSVIIKQKMEEIISENKTQSISDSKLAELLNNQGIKIARRTVAKYRNQIGMENSYKR